jgi:hypothetical protein
MAEPSAPTSNEDAEAGTEVWPPPGHLENAEIIASVRAGLNEALVHLRRSLVDAMRRDLAVDHVPWWRGVRSRWERYRAKRLAQAGDAAAAEVAPEAGPAEESDEKTP